MGTRSATGHDAILALRQANWAGPVKSRRHVVERVYPFGTSVSSGDADGEEGKKGDDALEVFLNGTVEYGLKNGRDVTIEWAAKAVFVEVSVDGGEDKASGLRFKFYQVYLVSWSSLSVFLLAYWEVVWFWGRDLHKRRVRGEEARRGRFIQGEGTRTSWAGRRHWVAEVFHEDHVGTILSSFNSQCLRSWEERY